jgi:hypothetical protein
MHKAGITEIIKMEESKKVTHGAPFYQNTRVSSCQFVKTVAGVPRAVAYPYQKTGYKAPNSYAN